MTLNLAYFVSHVSEIAPFRAEEGFEGRRLNALVGGSASAASIVSHGQALEVYVRSGRRILSHWHTDREAIFYCASGGGRLFLDELTREVGPGDAMFQPVHAIHGADNPGGVDLRMIEVSFPTSIPAALQSGEECFTHISRATIAEHRGATVRSLFPEAGIGEGRLHWCGELSLEAGQTLDPHAYPDGEQLLLVLDGNGSFVIEDTATAIRPGSVLYIPAGFTHAIRATSAMRCFGYRVLAGQAFVPRILRREGAQSSAGSFSVEQNR